LDQLRSDFEENGFAIVRRAVSQDEVDLLHWGICYFIHDNQIDMKPGEIYYERDGRIKSVSGLPLPTSHVRGVLDGIASTAFGVQAIAHATSYFPKYAHSGSETPSHQDNAFDCLEPPESLVMTIAIDRSDWENGCLTCCNGSHKEGLLPHEPSGILGFSQRLSDLTPIGTCINLNPGDVCIHHANTIHFSAPNNSDRDRRQFAIVYRTERAKRNEKAWARYQAQLHALHVENGLTV
jgi:phytanoyl-CoA hydroxylase